MLQQSPDDTKPGTVTSDAHDSSEYLEQSVGFAEASRSFAAGAEHLHTLQAANQSAIAAAYTVPAMVYSAARRKLFAPVVVTAALLYAHGYGLYRSRSIAARWTKRSDDYDRRSKQWMVLCDASISHEVCRRMNIENERCSAVFYTQFNDLPRVPTKSSANPFVTIWRWRSDR